MDMSVFDDVADALNAMVPRQLGRLRYRVRRFGIKVWFDDETPPREHYEAQVVNPDHLEVASVAALEVGFHAEHIREADNDAVIALLLGAESHWRPQLGSEARAGAFLGRSSWRRLSETWPDPDLDAVDLAFEVAARLTDYITAIESVRRTR
jgi:hypothetical protein